MAALLSNVKPVALKVGRLFIINKTSHIIIQCYFDNVHNPIANTDFNKFD